MSRLESTFFFYRVARLKVTHLTLIYFIADQTLLDDSRQVGKVIGGTRGNKVLEFISAAPSKEVVLNEPANIFDYSELEKYGYGVSNSVD